MVEARQERLSRGAWLAVLSIPLLVPVSLTNFTGLGFAAPFTADSTEIPKLVYLCFATASALLMWSYGLWHTGSPLRVPSRWWLPLGLSILAIISAMAAIHPKTTALGSSSYRQGLVVQIVLMLLFVLAVQLIRSTSRVKQITAATSVGSLMVAAYAAVQIAGLDPNQWPSAEVYHFERGFSTLGNPDMLGGFLLFGTITAAATSLSESGIQRKVVWWAVALFLASVTTLTLVRAAWMGLLVGLAMLALFAWLVRLRPVMMDWALTAAVPVILLLVAVIRNATNEGLLLRRLIQAVTQPAAESTGRLLFWQEATAIIADYPILGVGPDSYVLGWYGHQSRELVSQLGSGIVVEDPHSSLLMLAATIGIPAALFAVAWFVRVIVDAVRLLRSSSDRAPRSRMLYAGWAAALIGYLVYSTLGITTIASATLTVIALAVLTAPNARTLEPSLPHRRTATVVMSGLALLILVFASLALIADHYLVRGVTSGQPAVALPYVEGSARLMPTDFTYQRYLAKVAADIARIELRTGQPSMNAVERARTEYSALIRRFPAHYDGYLFYAGFLFELSEVLGSAYAEESVEVATEAIRVRPNGITARALKAAAHASLGQDAAVVETLADWWYLDPETPQPGLQYAAALLGLGKSDDAVIVLEELTQRFPDDSTVRGMRESLNQ